MVHPLKFRMEAGQTLRAARERSGLSQTEVARRAGTRQSVIARLESGKGGIPSFTLLDRVTRAIGLKVIIKFEDREAA